MKNVFEVNANYFQSAGIYVIQLSTSL